MAVRDLDEYPWDAVAPYARRAAEHPGGLVDLSIGSPVDETPAVVADALRAALHRWRNPVFDNPQLR